MFLVVQTAPKNGVCMYKPLCLTTQVYDQFLALHLTRRSHPFACPALSPIPLRPTHLGAAPVERHEREDLRDGAEPVEQHRDELDEQNQREKQHEDEADRLQLQILDGDQQLEAGRGAGWC